MKSFWRLGRAEPQPEVKRYEPKDYPVLVVPTRNRPTALTCLLEYLSHYYPGARVVIGDGGAARFQKINEKTCLAFSDRLSLDYRPYDPEIGLVERNRLVIESLPDDYYIWGADDDFPILETLAESKRFLIENPEYSICGGYNVMLAMNKRGKIKTTAFNAQSVEEPTPSARFQSYAALDFPTYYFVARRELHLSRYELFTRDCVVGFADYLLGFHDLLRGRLKVFDDLTYIRTSNTTHSYIRVTDKLSFLREAADIIKLKDNLAKDLAAYDNSIDRKEIDSICEDLIFTRIRFLTRDRANLDPTTSGSQEFLKRFIRKGDPVYNRFIDRVELVTQKLERIVRSDDNEGEARFRSEVDG